MTITQRRLMATGATLFLVGLMAITFTLPAFAGERAPREDCYNEFVEYRIVKQELTMAGWVDATGRIAFTTEWTREVGKLPDITDRPGGPWVLEVPKTINDVEYRYHLDARKQKEKVECPTTTTSTTAPEDTTSTTGDGVTTTTVIDEETTTTPVVDNESSTTSTTIVDDSTTTTGPGDTTTTDPGEDTTTTTVPPSGSTLPNTGPGDVEAIAGAGLAAMAAGVLTVLAARRKEG